MSKADFSRAYRDVGTQLHEQESAKGAAAVRRYKKMYLKIAYLDALFGWHHLALQAARGSHLALEGGLLDGGL